MEQDHHGCLLLCELIARPRGLLKVHLRFPKFGEYIARYRQDTGKQNCMRSLVLTCSCIMDGKPMSFTFRSRTSILLRISLLDISGLQAQQDSRNIFDSSISSNRSGLQQLHCSASKLKSTLRRLRILQCLRYAGASEFPTAHSVEIFPLQIPCGSVVPEGVMMRVRLAALAVRISVIAGSHWSTPGPNATLCSLFV